MTKVSRWPIEKQKMSLFLDDFWAAVASLKTKAEAKNFFNQFLTHTERKMFAKRFQIAMMHLLGYDYRTIRNRIHVSGATIAKINNWIEENRVELISVARRIIQLKETKLMRMEEGKKITKRTLGSVLLEEGAKEILKEIKEKQKEKSLLE